MYPISACLIASIRLQFMGISIEFGSDSTIFGHFLPQQSFLWIHAIVDSEKGTFGLLKSFMIDSNAVDPPELYLRGNKNDFRSIDYSSQPTKFSRGFYFHSFAASSLSHFTLSHLANFAISECSIDPHISVIRVTETEKNTRHRN